MTTFSPLLGLWEGVPFDPNIKNAWGPPLNTNDNLLEQAITGDNGYAGGAGGISIAGLSTYALTVLPGAADQARQLLYPFIGALTGACTVTIASTVKFGWAVNATTGGFNVVMTSGAGATATLPPDGLMRFFYCDGVGDVFLPGVGLGALTLSGALTIESGGLTIVSGGMSVSGNSTINGTLTGLTGLTIASGALGVNGGAFLNNGVSIGNGLTVTYGGALVTGGLSIASGNLVSPGAAVLGGTSAAPINTASAGAYMSTNGTLAIYSPASFPIAAGTASGVLANWFSGGPTQVGSITTSGASTSYNTTSDERLKVDEGPISAVESGRMVDSIVARWFRWKAPLEHTGLMHSAEPGFFAQQVHRFCRWAVKPGKGEPDQDEFEPWQMDNAKLIPVMLAEIQFLRKRVAALESKS